MILVTGVSGFLGKVISRQLPKVIGLGRSKASDIIVDLSTTIPKLPLVDLVIHAAGKAHMVPRTEAEKKTFYNVNVLGTQNLLKGLSIGGVPKQFVFISSVSVYGQEYGKLIAETHPLLAQDSYGLSKIAAEQLVENWCAQYGVVCTILRLPLLVGENPPGNLGLMIKAIDKGYYFNIGGGRAKKSMVLADDVATFIPKVASVGGIYNLTDGFHPSFKELSVGISKRKKKKIPLNLPLFIAKIIGFVGNMMGDKTPINSSKIKKITSDLTFDDSKARTMLRWNPQSVIGYLENHDI